MMRGAHHSVFWPTVGRGYGTCLTASFLVCIDALSLPPCYYIALSIALNKDFKLTNIPSLVVMMYTLILDPRPL
jgi:hypothetical protein